MNHLRTQHGEAVFSMRGAGVTEEAVKAFCGPRDPDHLREIFPEVSATLAANAWGKDLGVDLLARTSAFETEMDNEAVAAIVCGSPESVRAFNGVVDKAISQERGEVLTGLAKAFNRADEHPESKNEPNMGYQPPTPKPRGF